MRVDQSVAADDFDGAGVAPAGRVRRRRSGRTNRRPRATGDDAYRAQPIFDVAGHSADQQPESGRGAAALRAAIGTSAGKLARARPARAVRERQPVWAKAVASCQVSVVSNLVFAPTQGASVQSPVGTKCYGNE